MTDHYVTSGGTYAGGYGDGTAPDDPLLINLGDNPPESADQLWLFPGWGPSPSQQVAAELEWQAQEMGVIANQLLAIEEEAEDALPGTRKQWLTYRTSVRLWHESLDFPDATRRPVRPA